MKQNCQECNRPFVSKWKTAVRCGRPECAAQAHRRYARINKAKKAAMKLKIAARRKELRERVHHLPARVRLKIIMLNLLAMEYSKILDKALHSQAGLKAEQGATDTLDAVRRLSETATWRGQ